jgi:hypothetical protein
MAEEPTTTFDGSYGEGDNREDALPCCLVEALKQIPATEKRVPSMTCNQA